MARSAPCLQPPKGKWHSPRGVRRATAASSNDPPARQPRRVLQVRGVRRRAICTAARDERANHGTGAFWGRRLGQRPEGCRGPAHPEEGVMVERSVSRNRDAARLSRFGTSLHSFEKLTFCAAPFDEYRVGPLVIAVISEKLVRFLMQQPPKAHRSRPRGQAVRADVIVIGAGAAGVFAMRELVRSGLTAICVEARNRIGGRIFTRRSLARHPIELGAEFVHGEGNIVHQLCREYGLTLVPHVGEAYSWFDGQFFPDSQLPRPPQLLLRELRLLAERFRTRGKGSRAAVANSSAHRSARSCWPDRPSRSATSSSCSRTIIPWNRPCSHSKAGSSPTSPALRRTSTSTKATRPCFIAPSTRPASTSASTGPSRESNGIPAA